MQRCVYKKICNLAQMKQQLLEVWTDFTQTTVNKMIDQWRNDSGPVSFTYFLRLVTPHIVNRDSQKGKVPSISRRMHYNLTVDMVRVLATTVL